MIAFKAELTGDKALEAKLDALPKVVRDTLNHRLKMAAIKIHELAVKSIQEHRSQGRKYGHHVASLPGYPPNTDTGRLANSIKWELNTDEALVSVGTNLEYGKDLEYGTTQVAARPWLRPAVEQVKPQIPRILKG